jgi:hypothetical protein
LTKAPLVKGVLVQKSEKPIFTQFRVVSFKIQKSQIVILGLQQTYYSTKRSALMADLSAVIDQYNLHFPGW